MPTGPKECPQKTILAEEIRIAIRDILEIHNRHLETVLSGDFSTGEETEQSLKRARQAKSLVIERYREHVTAHGC